MQMHLCDVRYEKLPEEAKFIVLFRDPEDIFLTLPPLLQQQLDGICQSAS